MGRSSLRLHRVAWWAAVLVLAAVTMTCAPAVAAPQNAGQSDVATRELLVERDVADVRNSTQQSLQAAKDGAQKDDARIEAQQHEVNARVDDLKARISDLSFFVSLVAPCLTVLAIFVGVAAYWTAGQRANVAARTWMEEHAAEFEKQLNELNVQADELRQQLIICSDAARADVERIALGAKERISGHELALKQAIERLQKQLGAGLPAELSASDEEVLKQVDTSLQAKDESNYTISDWAERAYTAYGTGNFQRAEAAFTRAAAKHTSQFEWASFTIYRGVMLQRMGHYSEAMSVFEDVITRLGDTTEISLQKQLARALYDKGVSLEQSGRKEEALIVYDNLVARFDKSYEAVAYASTNKCFLLAGLERNEDALAACDAAIACYGASENLELNEQAARALICKARTLGKLKRVGEAKSIYDEFKRRYGYSNDVLIKQMVEEAERQTK